MSTFYILNGIQSVEADTAKAAARQYALDQNVIGGKVRIATNWKEFDISKTPADIQATDAA